MKQIMAAVLLALASTACGDDDGETAETTTTTTTTTVETTTTTTTTVPEPVTAPIVTGGLLVLAHKDAEEVGLRVESIDLAPEVLGEVPGARRGQWEPANWRVLGQCPVEGSDMTTADTLYVGVLKLDEASTPAINTGVVERIFDPLVCELSLDEAGENNEGGNP